MHLDTATLSTVDRGATSIRGGGGRGREVPGVHSPGTGGRWGTSHEEREGGLTSAGTCVQMTATPSPPAPVE